MESNSETTTKNLSPTVSSADEKDAVGPESKNCNCDEKKPNENDDCMFKPIDGEAGVNETIEVESLCVNCGENGVTKLLLTIIPFYKEVILSSFSCSHCSYSNTDIQSAGQTEDKGVEFTLRVNSIDDLNRKIVKSDLACVKIPEIELEIPSSSQKGEVTTIEGILQRTKDGLLQDQPARQKNYPEEYEKIQSFISKIEDLMGPTPSFTFILRDTSGASFVCPPSTHLPGQIDAQVKVSRFVRSVQEDHQIGIYPELDPSANENPVPIITGVGNEQEDMADEVVWFATNCSNCREECQVKMKMVKVPYFKEVIIMATDCDECGHRTNEVKSGSGIEDKGQKITLTVETVDDFSRDVLKSQTCAIEIPILELEVGAGTLGGKFTTLEGILKDIKEQILESYSKFCGDSEPEMKTKMEEFAAKFEKCLALEEPFTVIFDDPAGNSYIQNIQAPYDDPQLKLDSYERNFEQNEELGLNDMNTENY